MSLLCDLHTDDGKPIYTEAEIMRFRWMFSIRRTRQFLVTLPAIGAAFFMVLLQDERTIVLFGIPHVAWRVGIFLVLIGLLIFTNWNWRCPACDGGLRRTILPDHCDSCGITF